MSDVRLGFIKSKLGIAAAVLILGALPAWASLGGDRASVDADQVHLQGTRTTKTAESYTVHEIQASNGTVVREYVSAEGKVFAVAWNGPWMPDLRQLLGNYFEQYVQAAKAQNAARPGRRPLMIEQPGLVVQVGGHPRAFTGRSYVPEMLPAGVQAEEIR
ncbi:MAG: DUF2844 domain-containing protein [Candidatus Sulfotelmatobacter sp.]|jgi:hypothetical protein